MVKRKTGKGWRCVFPFILNSAEIVLNKTPYGNCYAYYIGLLLNNCPNCRRLDLNDMSKFCAYFTRYWIIWESKHFNSIFLHRIKYFLYHIKICIKPVKNIENYKFKYIVYEWGLEREKVDEKFRSKSKKGTQKEDQKQLVVALYPTVPSSPLCSGHPFSPTEQWSGVLASVVLCRPLAERL